MVLYSLLTKRRETEEGLSSRLDGKLEKALNVNEDFIDKWLENDLIEVGLMPTNRRRMNLQTRDMSSHLAN